MACLYMLCKLHWMKKHDKVLFAICRNRREAMAFLREQGLNITRKDYFALRDLLELQGQTIHEFNAFKAHVFNIRRFVQYMVAFRRLNNKFTVTKPDDPRVVKLCSDFGRMVLFAILTFTPLFRSELALRLTVSLMKALARVGGQYFKRKAREYSAVADWIKSQGAYQAAA